MTSLALDLRRRLPSNLSRLALSQKRVRTLRYKVGLVSTVDAAFLQLQPPNPRADEVIGPPNFVGIGAQKAGTSWWFDLLIRHPGVSHRPTAEINKERHFFSHYSLSEFGDAECEKYAHWFPRPEGTKTGEWTPGYFYYSWVPEMLRQAAPDTRLLLLLRDPVDRMISGLAHLSVIDERHLPREHLLQESFDRGLYAAQLRRWLEHFDASQMLVQQYEACKANPAEQMARTTEFLGLPPESRVGGAEKIVNPTLIAKTPIAESVRKRFARLYEDDLRELSGLVPGLDTDLWPSFSFI